MKTRNPTSKRLTYLSRIALIGCAAMVTAPSNAAYHLWQIRELYSDSSGSLQFIEMFSSDSSQQFVNSQQITVTSGGITHSFVLPNSSLSGSTANRALLFGTAGIHAAGAPTPDYTIPAGFLFAGGGAINFFGANSGLYSALPTDGV